jgi:hypothetical protein
MARYTPSKSGPKQCRSQRRLSGLGTFLVYLFPVSLLPGLSLSHVCARFSAHVLGQHIRSTLYGRLRPWKCKPRHSAQRYSIFGTRRASAASSLHTRAFLRQMVFHLSRSTCSIRMRFPFIRCRTASNFSPRAAPNFGHQSCPPVATQDDDLVSNGKV